MLKKILLNIISLLFKPFPRDNHLWVTGKIVSWEYDNAPPAFFDNSKYFFLYLVNHTDEKVYWLSSSECEIEMLRKMNLPVVRFPSIRGIWLILRARFSFHHYGPDQLNHILQRGSIQLDFWHGTPMKKIRYDIVPKEEKKSNPLIEWQKKEGREYISSTSRFLSEKVLMHAFDVPHEDMLELGYPRLDVLGLSEEDNWRFCNKYSKNLLPYIEKAKKYHNVLLYMPTYRDDDPDYIEKAGIDYNKLSLKLKEIDGIIFFKLHPLTRNIELEEYDNIIQIENDVDIYPFLTYTNYLITDYSSILFDYLVTDREMIFIPYDYDNYVKHRELYFDYDDITPGIKYRSFADFIDNIYELASLDYKKERKRIREMMITEYDFNACERIYQFVQNNYYN